VNTTALGLEVASAFVAVASAWTCVGKFKGGFFGAEAERPTADSKEAS
jgi:hypothetical protein